MPYKQLCVVGRARSFSVEAAYVEGVCLLACLCVCMRACVCVCEGVLFVAHPGCKVDLTMSQDTGKTTRRRVCKSMQETLNSFSCKAVNRQFPWVRRLKRCLAIFDPRSSDKWLMGYCRKYWQDQRAERLAFSMGLGS